jgi:hypothetical protein
VIREAVRLLRARALGPDYAQAWGQWDHRGDGKAWESVVADGLPPTS